jgi:TRAP-type C4-dicarboxylate transport system permease small subunit
MVSSGPSILKKLSLWLHTLGTIVIIPIMIIVITLDVFLRYFFKSPLLWSQDMNGLLLLIVFWANFTYTWDEGKHLIMDIFYRKFKGRWKTGADILTCIMGMIFTGLLAFKGFMSIPSMIRLNEAGVMLAVPLWPFTAFMALCSSLLFLELSILMAGHVKRVISGKEAT